ncbi:MAG: DUF559 domain-containing protein [Chitinophagaceae bacterium]
MSKADDINGKRRKILPYNPFLKEFAKELRKKMTRGEVALWTVLKQKQMLGYDFDRQRPILNYIVDFYCKELMLAIELDGNSHECKVVSDRERQKNLEALGVAVLRFSEREAREDIVNVVRAIEAWIEGKRIYGAQNK